MNYLESNTETGANIVVLATVNHYLPGFKSGGPVRSLENITTHLGTGNRFYIVTYDRDYKDPAPHSGIRIGDWNEVGKSLVYYVPYRKWSLRKWRKILSATTHDVLYLNSFFSPQFTIAPLLLRRFGLIPNTPVIVAPRGEFSSGALAIKKWKKKAYFSLAKAAGLYDGVLWHASSEFEKRDIENIFGRKNKVQIQVDVHIAEDLSGRADPGDLNLPRPRKSSGSVRLVFLSRLTRMKNLDGALRMLEGAKGEIDFSIYGPIEDQSYWDQCLKIAKRFSNNIHVTYRGIVPHARVRQVFTEYHFLYLPTQGENFGHVIYEALDAGLPIIISDQTPWRNLSDKGIGWDLPLSRPDEFHSVLQRCVEMGDEDYNEISQKAIRFAHEGGMFRNALEQHKELFRKSVGSITRTD